MVDHFVLCIVLTEKCWAALLHKGSEFRSLLSVDSVTYFTVGCEWLTLLVLARWVHSFRGNNSESGKWIILVTVQFLRNWPPQSLDLFVAGFPVGVLECVETILIPWSRSRTSLTTAVLHIGQGCVMCDNLVKWNGAHCNCVSV